MTPRQQDARFNAITWIQHLQWEVACSKSSAMEYQRIFEKVASRVRTDFMRVRPYGALGDRKCDGLYWSEGTVFQVYSPDLVKQETIVQKIAQDVTGAIEEWGEELKRWVFVYNTRLGLAPFVPSVLTDQQREHPNICIEPLSNDQLWQLMLKKLSVQQRAEILGALPGFELTPLPPDTTLEELEARIRDRAVVLIQDTLSPINICDAIGALGTERVIGPSIFVRPPAIGQSWRLATQYQKEVISSVLSQSRSLTPRFAVFSLAPIPLAIHLGYLLSDRVEVLPFHFDRDRSTWSWPEATDRIGLEARVNGLPTAHVLEPTEVVLRVSLTALIDPRDTRAAVGECPVEIDIKVDDPRATWLASPDQVVALRRTFRETVSRIREVVPKCLRIHLFYAGPTAGAVAIGQTINPRMNPNVITYEYNRKRVPRYERVLTLG